MRIRRFRSCADGGSEWLRVAEEDNERAPSASLPAGVPKRPPWFTEEQGRRLHQVFVKALGPQCITATSIDIEHLEEADRRSLVSSCVLRSTLRFVCSTDARFDAATQRGREGDFEQRFVSAVDGRLAARVMRSLQAGNRLMVPAAMTQVVREVIEWCPETIVAALPRT